MCNSHRTEMKGINGTTLDYIFHSVVSGHKTREDIFLASL